MADVKDNLGDVIVIITSQDKAKVADGENAPEESLYYPTTRIFRFDFEQPETNLISLINHIREHESIVDESMLKAEDIPFSLK